MSDTIDYIIACLRNHHADSCVLGNMRAGDALAAISALDRKAKAFDMIAAERVHGIREQNNDWKVYRTVADFKADRPDAVHQDLLTAIEAATALEAKETKDAR